MIKTTTLKDVLLGSIVLTQTNPEILSVHEVSSFGLSPCFCGVCPAMVPEHRSVDVGEYAVGHALAVLLPGQAVLPPALVLITGFSVDEQHGEVDDIEVRQEVGEPTREGPRQSHDEITQVIGMANKAPPSRNKQTLSRGRMNGFQMCKLWISRILAECVFLRVCTTEDYISTKFQSNDDTSQWPGQVMGMVDQVKGLEAVGERNPH